MFRKRRSIIICFLVILLLLTGFTLTRDFTLQSISNTKFDFSSTESKPIFIEPNNVKFQFTNPKRKQGTIQEIVKLNKKRYQDVVNQPISEPLDCKLTREGSSTKANATVMVLVRNNESVKIGHTIQSFQQKFNNKFKYPYTFLNDQPFTEKFKDKIRKYVGDIPVEFVTIPDELWKKPDFIDTEKEARLMYELYRENVAYARKTSYHNMCRFYSGNFYNVPELKKYKYYWRIEPNVDFFTDIKYDVFKYMQDTKKIYGFTIGLSDIEQSIKTLWPETIAYLNLNDNYKYINPNGAFQWLLDSLQTPRKALATGGYSTCHFWSNFEIGDMDFFRSDAYNNLFKYLDSTGKFYYERWGDAPVHSIGVSLFGDQDKVHWFRDIGYFHEPYYNCPNNENTVGCKVGKFSQWEFLWDQNCMSSWIDYHMKEGVY